MTDKELVEKRVLPALQQLYSEADTWFNTNSHKYSITWDQINKTISSIKERNSDYEARFILECFYVPEKRQKEIIKKATSNLRHYWSWPYKSQIIYDEEQIKEMKVRLAEIKEKSGENDFDYIDLKEKINNNARYKKQDKLWKEYYKKLNELNELLDKKEISNKEFNKRHETLAKSYGCTFRSRDAEAVQFEIWNYAPTSLKEKFDEYKNIWEFILSANCLKDYTVVENLVDEYYKNKMSEYESNGKMDKNKFNKINFTKAYMKDAWVFIENYNMLYGS